MKRFLTVGLMALFVIGLGLVNMGDVAATSLTSRVLINITGMLTGTASGATTPGVGLAASRTIDFANGVAASQADKVYSTQLTITTGATATIDVKGSLLDGLGVAFTPAKLKVVYIASVPCAGVANTTNLTLFGDANSVPILNTAATTSTLLPGGVFLMVQPPLAGVAVTIGTGDIILIVNGAGATACADVVLIGTSS